MMKQEQENILNVLSKKKVIIFILFCFLFIQCADVMTIKIKSSVMTQPQSLKVSHYDDLGSVLSIHPIGDKYIVSFYRDTLCLGILDSSMNILSRFGRKGRGPDELLAPRLTGKYSFSIEGCQVSVFERSRNIILTYHISNDGIAILSYTDSLPLNYGDMRIAYDIPNGYWGVLDNPKQNVFLFDEDTRNIYLHTVPERKGQGDYQTIVAAHPEHTLFALAYYSIPRIDIIGNDGKCKQILELKGIDDLPDWNGSNDFFLDISATDTYIYALFEYNDTSDLLLCLTWDGELISLMEICDSKTVCLNSDKFLCLNYDEYGLVVTEYPRFPTY